MLKPSNRAAEIHYTPDYGYVVASLIFQNGVLTYRSVNPIRASDSHNLIQELSDEIDKALKITAEVNPIEAYKISDLNFCYITTVNKSKSFNKSYRLISICENESYLKIVQHKKDENGFYVSSEEDTVVNLSLYASTQEISENIIKIISMKPVLSK